MNDGIDTLGYSVRWAVQRLIGLLGLNAGSEVGYRVFIDLLILMSFYLNSRPCVQPTLLGIVHEVPALECVSIIIITVLSEYIREKGYTRSAETGAMNCGPLELCL